MNYVAKKYCYERKHICFLQHLDRPGVSFCFQLENEAKINSIEIFKRPTATRSLFTFSLIIEVAAKVSH